MTKQIMNALEEQNIQNFLLCEYTSTTSELFFVKHKNVSSRNKNVTKCEVTIYHDFEKDGQMMRGSYSFFANPNMTKDFLANKIKEAYLCAASVCNPYFKLPSSTSSYGMFTPNEEMNHQELTNSYVPLEASDLADLLFSIDTDRDAFINSLEIFKEEKKTHIINSNGVDVSFSSTTYSGEYVVQCKKPEDVELYQDFKYASTDTNIKDSLIHQLHANLTMIKDRANAVKSDSVCALANCKNIILDGTCVYDLFHYYLERLDASMIYAGYSNYQIGDTITDNKNLILNIQLTPKVPYSSEGVKYIQTSLVKDNKVNCITGNARFSHYLGIPTIGSYNSYQLQEGTTSQSELFGTEPYLRICNFSDFQMDAMTGQFGGEYRLGYYFDGTKEIPVTSGSLSANINDILSSLVLSKETMRNYNYEGPKAVGFVM